MDGSVVEIARNPARGAVEAPCTACDTAGPAVHCWPCSPGRAAGATVRAADNVGAGAAVAAAVGTAVPSSSLERKCTSSGVHATGTVRASNVRPTSCNC